MRTLFHQEVKLSRLLCKAECNLISDSYILIFACPSILIAFSNMGTAYLVNAIGTTKGLLGGECVILTLVSIFKLFVFLLWWDNFSYAKIFEIENEIICSK